MSLIAIAVAAVLSVLTGESALELNARAVKLLEERRFDEAIPLFERAVESSDSDPVMLANLATAHNNRGVDLLNRRQYAAAVVDLEASIRLNPDNVRALTNLGFAYFRQRDFGRAEANLLAAQSLAPEDARVLRLLGQLYYVKDDLAKAVGALEASVALNAPDEGNQGAADLLERAQREFEVSGDYVDRSSNDFTLKFLGSARNSKVADEVLAMLADARARVGSDLGHFPREKTVVLLYDTADFRKATGMHQWVGGLFDGKIRLPVRDLEQHRESLTTTARHEYTHRVVADLAPRCPLWITEGLAQWFENDGRDAHQEARQLVARGVTLPRMSDVPASWASLTDVGAVKVYYAMSLSFVTFLRNRYGVAAVRAMLVDLGRGSDVDQAMQSAFGRNLDELDELWRRDVLQ